MRLDHLLSKESKVFVLCVLWGFSSAGRAPALHAGGQEFESLNLHQSILKRNAENLEN